MTPSPWSLALWALVTALVDALFPVHLLFRPSVGIAIATLFLFGPRAWTVAAFGGLASGLALLHSGWEIALDVVVDVGQAFLAWSLVKRYIGLPAPLFKTSHLMGFHLLIGPVAMGVGSALKVLGHTLLSVGPSYSAGLAFLYLWLAQSFGAVLLTTTVLSLVHPEYPWCRRRLSVALPTLVLLALTFYARWLVGLRVEALQTLSLSRHADLLAQELQHELYVSDSIIRATSSLFASSEQVSGNELEQFLSSLVRGRVAPLSVAWLPSDASQTHLLYPGSSRQGQRLESVFPADFLQAATKSRTQGVRLATTLLQGETPRYLVSFPVESALGQSAGTVVGAFDLKMLAKNALADTQSSPDVALTLSLQKGEERYLLGHSEPSGEAGERSVTESYSLAGLFWSVQAQERTPPLESPRLGMVPGLVMSSALLLFLLRLNNQTTRIEGLKQDLEMRADALRQLNEELESAVEAARRADHAKSLFLANISHEIRTPLNGILGLTRLVLDSGLGPAQREQLGHVEMSAQNLLTLFNSILDVARMESRQSLVQLAPCSLSSLLQETSGPLGLAADEKGVELIFAMGADLPDTVHLDALKLRQVLLNLTSNAIRFTPAGGDVELSVSSQDQSDGLTTLSFAVRDTGVGIAADQLEDIFLPFVQAEGAPAEGGSGLGLAISRALVEQMGGELTAQSQPGRGSTFTFSLSCQAEPSHAPSFPAQEAAAVPIQVGLRHARQRAVIEQTLSQWGFPLVQEPAAAKLLVLDHTDLPATRLEDRPAIVVMALSELGTLLESCLQAGAVPLARPFTRSALQEAIHQALQPERTSPARSPAPGDRAEFAGKVALVVDDNLTNRLLATLMCERMGFEVENAADGEGALRLARHRSYDVILLDISLPGMDGYQVATKLREHGVLTPIVAATAHADADQRQDLGLAGFLTKPLEARRLRDTLAAIVPVTQGGHGWDLEALVRSVGGDLESAREVARGYLQEADELRQALVHARTSEQLAQACHTLRGAVEVFGLSAARDTLAQLELSADEGQVQRRGEQTELDSQLDELERQLRRFVERPHA